MRKKEDNSFFSLLQSELFFDQVKNTEGFPEQIKLLAGIFSEEENTIKEALEFINFHLAEKKRLPSEEADRIWKNIEYYKNCRKRKLARISLLWKVAAVLILVFTSSAMIYYYSSAPDTLKKYSKEIDLSKSESIIILADGSEHKLKKGSEVDISPDGKQVIIKKDNDKELFKNIPESKKSYNQIIVPFGHRHKVTLCDGTEVELNSGSSFIFPAEFNGKQRKVYLKGEGFFKVFKNSKKAFIVETDFFDVKVLGTVFNISAYEEEHTAMTVLVEGKVVVSQNDQFSSKMETIKPGQAYFYSSSTFSSKIQDINVEEYISWKDGILLFNNKPLTYVINRVERYYNRKITINEEKLKSTLISGKLVLSDRIEEVIRTIAKTLEADYKEKDDKSFSISTQY